MAGSLGAACLVMALFALRERLSEHAPRRMSTAVLAGILAAGAMVLVASNHAAIRQLFKVAAQLRLVIAAERDAEIGAGAKFLFLW